VVFDLINVVQGVAKLSQALIRDKRLENLWLLPASQTRDKDALTDEGVGRIIADLRTKFDWILCDSPAGIERGATLAMRYADEAVVVTNPEVSSVRDSDRIIGMLDSKTVKAEKGERVEKHVLITRYDSARAARGEMLSIEDILEILATPLLGIIPESQDVLRASNVGSPVTLNNAASAPARAYVDAVRRLMGETVTMMVPVERKGLMNRLRLIGGRTASAPVARERLQILLAHERGLRGQPELLGLLRAEILAVVSRHVVLDPEKVIVRMERGKHVSTLEVDIEVPTASKDRSRRLPHDC